MKHLLLVLLYVFSLKKTGILFQKILLLACVRLQDKAQAIGF